MAILQTTDPKISVIILNYKTDELVVNLLRLIDIHRYSDTHGNLEIIIIDNSPEETLVKKLPQSRNVHYFFQNKNLGFSAGNNEGIKKAKGEWILLLNSDTITNGNDIRRLVDICRDCNYDVASPRLKSKEGIVQNSVGYFDSPIKSLINWMFARPRFVDCPHVTENTKVDLATGAALLIKKTVFEKVGLLDAKNFFMYFEDIDFCYRLHEEHIPILYIPEVEITHFEGVSADKNRRQKNSNYQKGLENYIRKHRGEFLVKLNKSLKFFK